MSRGSSLAVSPQSVAAIIYSLGHVLSVSWSDLTAIGAGTGTGTGWKSGVGMPQALLGLVQAALRSPMLKSQELAMTLLGLRGASAAPSFGYRSKRQQVLEEQLWKELYAVIAEAAIAAFERGRLGTGEEIDGDFADTKDHCTSQGLVSITLGMMYLLRTSASTNLQTAADLSLRSPRLISLCAARVAYLLRNSNDIPHSKKSITGLGLGNSPRGMREGKQRCSFGSWARVMMVWTT